MSHIRLSFLVLAGLLTAAPAFAQAFDASLPDASVGSGGADQSSEENDPNAPCLDSRSCDHGFACVDGRCVPSGIREASGCAVGGAGLALSSLIVLSRCRRRRARG